MADRVEARAPTRIDLAGGTVDLWPLHLLHERPITVNVAINLYARATVERSAAGIAFISEDRRAEARFDALEDLQRAIPNAPPDLEFPMRLAGHFLGAGRPPGTPPPACRIITSCEAPAGSGLGGSSTLGIALASALDRFVGRGLGGDERLAVTRAIETQVLRIPTGEQDYHPALRGGALALHYTVEGTRVERLPIDLDRLGRQIVLVDSGRSRSSGISNWDMMKRHLDGDRAVRDALDRVIGATHDMRRAILSADWVAAGEALGREWEARKALSPAVTSDRIEELIAAGRAAGAAAGKVCGAGGGGCLVLWAGAGRRDRVRDRITAIGATVLEARPVGDGVVVTES